MHHFFVTPQQISGDKIRIEGGDVNHMKNVLRMKLHEKAEISDGESRTYLCEVEAYAGRCGGSAYSGRDGSRY